MVSHQSPSGPISIAATSVGAWKSASTSTKRAKIMDGTEGRGWTIRSGNRTFRMDGVRARAREVRRPESRGARSTFELLQDVFDLLRLGKLRVATSGGAQRLDGVVLLPELVIGHPQVVLDRDVVWRKPGRLSERWLGLLVGSPLVVDPPQRVEDSGAVGRPDVGLLGELQSLVEVLLPIGEEPGEVVVGFGIVWSEGDRLAVFVHGLVRFPVLLIGQAQREVRGCHVRAQLDRLGERRDGLSVVAPRQVQFAQD